jgi:hypothetical protein
MINSISSYINELATSLLEELDQNTLIELSDMPYDAIHAQLDANLGVYIRNAYLSHNSKLREENSADICAAIIEKLWCRLQTQKF